MKALTKILAGGAVAVAALVSAAPASAQYYDPGYGYPGGGYGYGYPGGGYGYPGYGYGSPYGSGGIIGTVINSVIGGGNRGYGYGYNQPNPYQRYGAGGQYAINQCMGAVQQRIGGGYGYNNGYPQQGAFAGARVLGISDVERRSNGGFTVRGVANSGRNAAYGYGQYGQPQVDLTFRCKTDATGYIVDIDLDQATSAYGQVNGAPAYTPYNTDYSQYGYRRY